MYGYKVMKTQDRLLSGNEKKTQIVDKTYTNSEKFQKTNTISLMLPDIVGHPLSSHYISIHLINYGKLITLAPCYLTRRLKE